MASGNFGRCGLSECNKEVLYTDGRADVRAFPVSKSQRKGLKVNWSDDGEAMFHLDCWRLLAKAYRAKDPQDAPFTLSALEQDLIKEATKTAEFHNSAETLKNEANRIAKMLQNSNYCIAFTGAGISTAAGIGDFRGKDGKWTNQAKEKSYGSKAVKRTRGLYSEQLRPTYTHEAIVKLLEKGLIKYLISQNTDGLHRLSGVAEGQISELHGNCFVEKCEKCETRYTRNQSCRMASSSVPPKACERCRINHRTGRICDNKSCGGYLMNTIINFGDYLEQDVLHNAIKNAERADLVLALGTTLQVSPANSLVEMGQRPTRLILCNRQVTPYDDVCRSVNDDGEELGSRVYGDCDDLMREVMIAVLTKEEYTAWEGDKKRRQTQYNMQRIRIG